MPKLTPTRILIVRIGAMGDVLHALPAVTALRNALPGTHLGWAVEPHWAALLSPALVDHIHPVPTRAWKEKPLSLATARSILTLRRELRAQRYDLTVDLQGSIRSAVVGRMAASPRFLGPEDPREAFAAHLYREPIPTPAVSVIEQAVQLLAAGIGQPLRSHPALLPQDPAAEAWADALALPPRFTLLLPGAGWGAKRWPHFATLARALAAAGHPTVVNATFHSAAIDAARAIPSTLPQLIALTRRAALAIGGDTGPLHLAAALCRPTIALFGPTDPARNGPHFPQGRAGSAPAILRNAASQTTYRRTETPDSGLAAITVEEVSSVAFSLLKL